MNAVLIPGMPSKRRHYDVASLSNSEDHWFSWLKRQLILKDIHAVSVETPFPFRPRYEEWKKEFERFDLESNTILVGHSCGGGFLVRYLSEHTDLQVGKVVLVAPWMNPENQQDIKEADTADFFDFKIDPDFPSRTKGVSVFISSDDSTSIIETVDILKDTVKGLDIHQYDDKGHFCFKDLGTREFPELLAQVSA